MASELTCAWQLVSMPAHRVCQRYLSARAPTGAPAGPPELQPGDIPTSAVDFHVSDIAPALLATCPPVAAAAAAAAAATSGTDPEERLRRAMWRAPKSRSTLCCLSLPLESLCDVLTDPLERLLAMLRHAAQTRPCPCSIWYFSPSL